MRLKASFGPQDFVPVHNDMRTGTRRYTGSEEKELHNNGKSESEHTASSKYFWTYRTDVFSMHVSKLSISRDVPPSQKDVPEAY